MSTTDKVKFSTMRSAVFFSGIGLLSIAMLYLFEPFLYPIFWAAVIAIMFYPIYQFVHTHIKSANLSATILLMGVILIIFIPLALLSLLLVNETIQLYNTASQSGIFAVNADGVASFVEKTPLAPYVDTIKTEWTNYASAATKSASNFLVGAIGNITSNGLKFLFMTFMML